MDDPVGNEVDAEGHRDIRSLFDLSGRVALVTGGSRGLGLAMAEGLAEAGAMVAVAARRREWLDQAVATLRRHGRPCIGVELDIADGDRVETAVDEVLSAFGRVDVLVNAAATIWGAPPLETPVEQWRRVLEVNVTGTYLVTRRVARHMVAAGG
ncbi:MAG: SDR family NAD(P)-dependent oxidoreductase, partial [Clostridia bacterium]|nr:SDR family NAD(P)-dependent oxidoreductase [Clostridia bacterium]